MKDLKKKFDEENEEYKASQKARKKSMDEQGCGSLVLAVIVIVILIATCFFVIF